MGQMRLLLVLLLLFAATGFGACGSARGAATLSPVRYGVLGAETPDVAEMERGVYDPALSINHAGFSLFVLDEWGEVSPAQRDYYDFTVRTLMNGDTYLSVYARGLKDAAASMFVLKYNPDEWKVINALAGSFYGGAKESLFLFINDYGGTLPFALARVRPQDNGLISGDGLIAEISLSPGSAKGRRTVAATAGESSVVLEGFSLNHGGETIALEWNDRLRGDYDNSGKVNIADITPLAVFFGGHTGDGQGNDAAEGFIDSNSDGNGVISIADVTPIAVHFGASITGYSIYRTVQGTPDTRKRLPHQINAEQPFSISRAVSDQWQPAPYAYGDSSFIDDFPGTATTFEYSLAIYGDSGEGAEIAQQTILISPEKDTLPPHGLGGQHVPFAGVTGVDAGDGRLKIVYRRNAIDNYTLPENIRYYLYVGPPGDDSGIDLSNSIIMDVTDTPSPYIWEGLANGTTYAAYLAAEDEAGNRTSPALGTVKTGTPSAAARNDLEPPEWVDTIGVVTATPGNRGIRVTFGEAVDAMSPPVRYRIYWASGPEVPFDTASFAETDSSPFSLTGLYNDVGYSVAVRAIDSADRYDPPINPNEDSNAVTLYVTPRSTAGDVDPPTWDDTTGVVNLVPGEGSIRVEFGTASDPSEPVTYNIYYQEGGEVDFTSATQVQVATTNYPPTFVDGVTDGQEYAVAIRAQDAVGNEEKNTVMLTTTPDVGLDNHPPEWDTTIGVQNTRPGNGYMDLGWNSATDDQSPPVVYRVYWELGNDGVDYALALSENRYLDTSDLFARVDGLMSSFAYSFAVRARDSAPTPNEDYNLVFLTATPTSTITFADELVADETDPVQYTHVEVASDGTIGIAYAVASEPVSGKYYYELKYAYNDGSGWATESVCGSGAPTNSRGKMPMLKFDASDVPYIVFINNTHEWDDAYTAVEIVHRTGPGAWTAPQTVDGGGSQAIFINPALEPDSSGDMGVAYIVRDSTNDSDDNTLRYASYNGATWDVEEVNDVKAGGAGTIDGSNCGLGYGVYSIMGDDPIEMPTIAFSDPSLGGALCWTLRRGADDWLTLTIDDASWMTHIDMCMWETEIGGNTYALPRISYRLETGSAHWVVKFLVEDSNLTWELQQADWQADPGTGFYSDVEVASEAGFELIFTAAQCKVLNRAHFCVEDLVTGEYFRYDVPPLGGTEAGKYLSMALLREFGSDHAVLTFTMDGNLYVSIMD